MIETINLCQRYGERDIIKNINLKVEQGEVFTLIGPTGAGKTTLLRLINLLDTPTAGRIIFDGMDTATSSSEKLEIRRRMAFILQKPVVFNMSVFDNIAYGLKWRGVEKSNIIRKVDSVLDMVGLSNYKNVNAKKLSGGEVQRVAIARAITIKPEVLLLDEPTANLDPISASRVESIITDIIKQQKTTIIMATHDMSQGQLLADRIGVLVNGEIMQVGNSNDIFSLPGNRAVAEFVGVENVIDGVLISNEDKIVTIETKGGVIEAVSDYPTGESVSACIRPENITLSLSKSSSSARNSFSGKVKRVISTGPLSRVEIDCGFPLVCLITRKSAAELDLNKDKEVYATFKATEVHVIKGEK
ncbi:ABC transporter ATP-binding protein [Chloroflexota bacterium]